MHPIFTAAVAEDLRQRRMDEADHHRLARVAHGGRRHGLSLRVATARRLVELAGRIDPRMEACLDDGVAGRAARA
jgi:hypothetical protein